MWEDLVALMADGVRTGVIRTVRDDDLTEAERRDGGRVSYVYRRAGDPCRSMISRRSMRSFASRTKESAM